MLSLAIASLPFKVVFSVYTLVLPTKIELNSLTVCVMVLVRSPRFEPGSSTWQADVLDRARLRPP